MSKVSKIFLEALPILVMIGLIPLIKSDYILSLIYIVVIYVCLKIKKEKNDFTLLVFGFSIMFVSEAIFISTGVEVFIRNTLFGLMPLWLPLLWAYAFVAMKRSLNILG